MRDLRILKDMEKKPPKKKKLPILLITIMGILVFFGLFLFFEENPDENILSDTSLSSEKDKDPGPFGPAVAPGKMRIDSGGEAATPPREANKKPIGPSPKKELTFLKTLKEERKETAPLKSEKQPKKAQEITASKKKLRKTKQAMTTPTPPRKPVVNRYAIQVASFPTKNNAEVLAGKLIKKGYKAYVVSKEIPQRGRWYRVRVGHYEDRAEAVRHSIRIKRSEKLDSFVTSDHR